MSSFKRVPSWRAGLLACGLALCGPASAIAGMLNPAAIPVAARSIGPFGLFTAPVPGGELRDKWLGVEREIDAELLVITLCQEDRARCGSAAALQLLGIVDEAMARDGRARLGEVNRAINLAIRPASDLALYGAVDVWRSPLALLAEGAGDCEDYAIAKLVALRVAGIAADDLRLVILRDLGRHEDHAVAAVRLDGNWLLLDNRRMAMVEDSQARQIRPLFVIDHNGVRKYPDAPLLANKAPPVAEPADLMKLALLFK
ncbi:MAG TPA: transglutaminase-like cysteine peptidase [Tardiphaga sp.]